MEKKILRRQFISSKAIQEINDATIVLRHFIELSAKLLPYFNNLSMKERLLPIEAMDRQKIQAVFQSYTFDTSTSLILMDSKMLDIVKATFSAIEQRIPGETSLADDLLSDFFCEYDQLVLHWNQTAFN
jgi:hypothetical protein